MTEHHEEDEWVFNPQPMQVPPNCDPDGGRAFLRHMVSPVNPMLKLMLAEMNEAIRQMYPGIESADL
jgi:hypothetical protein